MTYSVIAIDPPWHEPGGNGKGSDDHYATIRDVADIARVVTSAPCWRPAKDCVLACWTTMTSLPDALELVRALDFTYKTHGVWVKVKQRYADGSGERLWRVAESDDARVLGDVLSSGIGQYLRGAHELWLLATRGSGFNVRTDDKSIPSVLFAPTPRREVDGQKKHSAKPPEFFAMIDRRFSGLKLEMFAASTVREGWMSWG